jgi:integrase
MARKVKDKELDSKDARRKLKPRGKPYWRGVEKGLHLGYRRHHSDNGHKAGVWIARFYVGDQQYKEEQLGIADDLSDKDGVKVLDYWQAVNAARAAAAARARASAGLSNGAFTVADAIREYVTFLEGNRKTAKLVRQRAAAYAIPELGHIEVNKLTADQLRKWHAGIAKQPARLRTKPGEKQRHREHAHDNESIRRRRSSANRCLSQLKAALNLAWREKRVSCSDEEWRRVKPFGGADAARVRYLELAECKRLINACDQDFRNVVRAALETGARYGELCRLEVGDFNRDTGLLAIRTSKTSKARHVVLTDEGVSFFQQICAGRTGSETMLLKASGSNWRTAHQNQPMADACRRAKIDPPIGIHALRHTWASLSVMNAVPLLVVARNLGHTDTRMVEKHYGHLAPSYVADAIRAGAPRFGKVETKVKAIR